MTAPQRPDPGVTGEFMLRFGSLLPAFLTTLLLLFPYSAARGTAPAGAVISNQAVVSYTAGGYGHAIPSNVDEIKVLASDNGDSASLVVATTPAIPHPGDLLTLTVTATNTGAQPLQQTVLSLRAPPGARIFSPDALSISTASDGEARVELPDIAPGAKLEARLDIQLAHPGTPGPATVSVTLRSQGSVVAIAAPQLELAPRTAAQVQLLQYSPAGTVYEVRPSRYLTAASSYADITPPFIPGTEVAVTASPVHLLATGSLHRGQTLFLRVADADQNKDPNVAEWVALEAESRHGAAAGDRETVLVQETGPNTGVFLGYVTTGDNAAGAGQANDGVITTGVNREVVARYRDGGDEQDQADSSILIDPYGVVFDSTTGTPLNGVTVSLVNAATGAPATVYGDDGLSAYPATVVTGGTVSDASGVIYTFPAGNYRFPYAPPGEYRLIITLPESAGYSWPSSTETPLLQSLPGAPYAIAQGSRGEVFTLQPGPPLHLDIPLDAGATPLYLSKSASKAQAGAGDFVQYRIGLQNTRTLSPVEDLRLVDVLPQGFRYAPGSARLDDATLPDPVIAADGRTLRFELGTLAAGAQTTLHYVTRVGAAPAGEAVNSASAQGAGRLGSNTAHAIVNIKEELMQSRAVLMGQVTATDPEAPAQRAQGVAGVRIYLENGTYTLTDERGRYHFEGVRPGTHVVQLDLDTLPAKYEFPPDAAGGHRGRAWSRFVDLQGGASWRVDFDVTLRPRPRGDIQLKLDARWDESESVQRYRLDLGNSGVPLSNARLILMLPQGLIYEPASTTGADEPALTGNVLTFRLGEVAADGGAQIELLARVSGELKEGSYTARATLLFDTSAAQNQRLPAVETTLLASRIAAGRESRLFALQLRFAPFSTQLGEADRAELKVLAEQLKLLQNVRLEISGHSDNKRIRATNRRLYPDNEALALERARQVARFLREQLGLKPETATVIGKGDTEPVASNDTAAERAANRRVEVRVIADAVIEQVVPTAQASAASGKAETQGLRPHELPAAASPPTSQPGEVQRYDQPWLDGAAPGDEWLYPTPDALPPIPAIHVGVKHAAGHKLKLLLNGAPVNSIYFERTLKNTAGSLALSEWRGLPLEDGANRLELVVTDASGTELSRETRTLHYAGPPVKVELVKEQSVLKADGKTAPVIALRLVDKDGKPARPESQGEFRVDAPYRAQARGASARAQLAGVPAERPRYTVGADGIALIALEPTTEAGHVVLHLPLTNGEHKVSARLAPEARDWILVGYAQGTAGYNTLRGHTEALGADAPQDKLYQDGQITFFAKGRVRGEWLLTLAYDSGKEKQNALHQAVDPGAYYTLYGDASEQRAEAASARKLYVKLERDAFYALYGDYDTALNAGELTAYSRSLTGLKSRYQGERYDVMVFASPSDQSYVKDELRGTGLTGPYRLTRRNLLLNSEKVRLQARDRLRSERIVSERALSRHLDYDVDYDAGTLTFRDPVMSVDDQLNLIYIVVDYESYDGADRDLIYGGRAQLQVNEQLQIGVMHINEGRAGGEAGLNGVDARYQIDAHTQARVEYARSRASDTAATQTGNAYAIAVDHRSDALELNAYVREQGVGYGLGQTNRNEQASRKLGGQAVYHASPELDVRAQAYQQSLLDSGDERRLTEAEAHYAIGDTQLSAGVRLARDELASGETQSSELITAGITRSFMQNRLVLRAMREQALRAPESADFPSRLRLGADYQLSGESALFVTQEWAQGAAGDTQQTLLGLKTAPWRDSELTTALARNSDTDSGATRANVGLQQRWRFAELWSLDASLERSDTLAQQQRTLTGARHDANAEDYTATSLGLTYRPQTWQWNGRIEFRDGSERDRWNLLNSVQTEPRSDLGLLASWRYHIEEGAGSHESLSDLRLGLVYRPEHSPWTLLDRLDWIRERRDDTQFNYDNWRLVNNLSANYRAQRWQASLLYGAKYVREAIDGTDYAGYTQLLGFETRHDIKPRWDVGLHASTLQALAAGHTTYAYGIDVGHSFTPNVWVSLGYNLRGFTDKDFSQAEYSAAGPYLRFRMKFDQASVGEALRNFDALAP